MIGLVFRAYKHWMTRSKPTKRIRSSEPRSIGLAWRGKVFGLIPLFSRS